MIVTTPSLRLLLSLLHARLCLALLPAWLVVFIYFDNEEMDYTGTRIISTLQLKFYSVVVITFEFRRKKLFSKEIFSIILFV